MTEIEPKKAERVNMRWRRLLLKCDLGLAILLAVILALEVNYLSMRHHLRLDWSRSKLYTLSDKTMQVLKHVDQPIQITVFFELGCETRHDVKMLLKEYQYACRHLNVAYVDPDRDLGQTSELVQKYGDEINAVFFESDGQVKKLSELDIFEFERTDMKKKNQRPERKAFKGEQAFTTAIYKITQAETPRAYFLQGHGERDPKDFSPREGYSQIAQFIRDDNIEVLTLNLHEQRSVPEDCDVLIVAGPTRRFLQTEIDMIQTYLKKNGRAVFLLSSNARTGLEHCLKDWGVKLGNDMVIDPSQSITGRGDLRVDTYADHPITNPLRGMMAVLYVPRSVMPIERKAPVEDTADRPHVTILAACSEKGWGETEMKRTPIKYDKDIDTPGPLGVVAAVELGSLPDIDVQLTPTRFVVFGDSYFLANNAIVGANADFLLNALNWLLDRDELMAISPKTYRETRLLLSRRQLSILAVAVLIGLPGCAALIGLVIWVRRRR